MMLPEDEFCELIEAWLPHGGRVLDVGCGGGGTLQFLAERGIRGVGIDPYASGDERCRRLRAEEMDQLGEAFDLVYTRYALHHFGRPRHFPAQAREVLRPGGVLVIVDWVEGARTGLPERYVVPEDLARWVREAGFQTQRHEIRRDIATVVIVASAGPVEARRCQHPTDVLTAPEDEGSERLHGAGRSSIPRATSPRPRGCRSKTCRASRPRLRTRAPSDCMVRGGPRVCPLPQP